MDRDTLSVIWLMISLFTMIGGFVAMGVTISFADNKSVPSRRTLAAATVMVMLWSLCAGFWRLYYFASR